MNENCTVVSGQLEYMPFNDNYFDKIIVLDYLNHTADCNKSVKEIKRVLKHRWRSNCRRFKFKRYKS